MCTIKSIALTLAVVATMLSSPPAMAQDIGVLHLRPLHLELPAA
jgi:hypothetical protein